MTASVFMLAHKPNPKGWIFSLALVIAVILSLPLISAPGPSTVLVSPADGNVTDSAAVELSCNASDDQNVYRISFYDNSSGNFALKNVEHIMELDADSNTLLLCRFDNTYVCENGENGVNNSVEFSESRFLSGLKVGNDGSMKYPTSDNILYDEGTIEFWLKLGFSPSSAEHAWLFSTGNSGNDEIQIYFHFTDLCFDFYGTTGSKVSACSSVSWNEGEWHHVAAVWDMIYNVSSGREVDFYLDSSNESMSYDGSIAPGGSLSEYIYIGSDANENGQSDSVFDELRISDYPRTAGEINESYIRGTASHADETAGFNLTGLPDGSYLWSCVAMDQESQQGWAQNRTFTIERSSPPSVKGVNTNPDSEDDIDPGVTVNFTANISDVSGVSAVILQYKTPLAGSYMNDTMQYNPSTGLWENGSIPTTTSEVGNWSYRFWFNDTKGNAGYSQTYNLPVNWDSTWLFSIINSSGNLSDSFGFATGFASLSKTLGSLLINNTGDCSLNFNLQSSPWYILIGYNRTEPFDLAAGSVTQLEVNATMPDTPNEYTGTITITSSGGSPASQEINYSIISFVGGPYINQTTTITAYPSVAYQSNNYTLTAMVRNIGNETAENVWVNWLLPNGWTVSGGNSTHYVGNISAQYYSTATITAYISSSTSPRTVTVNVSSNCTGGAGSDYENVVVLCNSTDSTCGTGCSYLTDSDCTAPAVVGAATGGSTTGSSMSEFSGGASEPVLSVSLPDSFGVVRGGIGNFTVRVSNTVSGTSITGISFLLLGYPQQLVKTYPASIDLSGAESKTFIVEVSAPTYMEEKEYIATITVSGTGIYGSKNKTLSYTSRISLHVEAATKSEVLESLSEAEAALLEMQEAGFSISMAGPLLDDARKAYSEGDYNTAGSLSAEVTKRKDLAFSVVSSIKDLNGLLQAAASQGIAIDGARRMLSLAQAAFERGDYLRAGERIDSAMSIYRLETGAAFSALTLLKDAGPKAFAVLLLMLAGLITFRKTGTMRIAKSRFSGVEKRKASLLEAAKKIQEDYFSGKLSKDDYTSLISANSKRVAGLDAEQARLSYIISGTKAPSAEKRLKELQDSYFVKGAISKAAYGDGLEAIEREANHNKKGLLAFALLAILLIPGVYALNATRSDAQAAIASAQSAILGMKSLGFGTQYANQTLSEALSLYASGDYLNSMSTARYVLVIKQKASSVNELIDDVELRLEENRAAGRDVSKPSGLFLQGEAEFRDENYDNAEGLLNQAMDGIDELERQAAISWASGSLHETAMKYIQANLQGIVITSVTVAMAALAILALTGKARRAGRVARIRKEIAAIRESMKAAQESYFNSGSISKKAYKTRMAGLRHNLDKMAEELGELVSG